MVLVQKVQKIGGGRKCNLTPQKNAMQKMQKKSKKKKVQKVQKSAISEEINL